jgi:hypothetical protein
MVSWGFAFKKGAVIFAWSILWTIVFGVFLVIAGVVGLFGIWGATDLMAALGGVIGGIIIAIVGAIIYQILLYATILKITMESTLEEAKKP